jgi:hypothetical protein
MKSIASMLMKQNNRDPLEEFVFRVRDLTKIYLMGEVEVHALRGVNLEQAAAEPSIHQERQARRSGKG